MHPVPDQGYPDDPNCRLCKQRRVVIREHRFCLECDGPAAALANRRRNE